LQREVLIETGQFLRGTQAGLQTLLTLVEVRQGSVELKGLITRFKTQPDHRMASGAIGDTDGEITAAVHRSENVLRSFIEASGQYAF